MAISPRNVLTDDPQARFFLAPETSQQRQYEALRNYFVEKVPSHEVAHRFGYTPGAFRVLCHQFRHDPAKRAVFFPPFTPGPHAAPKRDRVRNLAVAMRKRNLSVYDIRRELAVSAPVNPGLSQSGLSSGVARGQFPSGRVQSWA